MGRSSRRKLAKEKKPCCLAGHCHSHLGRPPLLSVSPASGPELPEIDPGTAAANRLAAAAASAATTTTTSAVEVAGKTRSKVRSGPNVATTRPAGVVPERQPPVAPGGARRKRKNKPKVKAVTSTGKVENVVSKESCQAKGCVNAERCKKTPIPSLPTLPSFQTGQKRGPTDQELLEIRKATGMVNFLTHFLQFTVDFDVKKDYKPMSMFGKGIMREMLMKSKFFLPMLESLKEMWLLNDGLKDEEYCNVRGFQLFLKWRKFGLLFRRCMAMRREWEACVLRFGLKDIPELRKALVAVDRSVYEISKVFDGNKECTGSIKRFLMQRPDLVMPGVFVFEMDLREREYSKTKEATEEPKTTKRERSRSCQDGERVKMEREKKAGTKCGRPYFSHAGRNMCVGGLESDYSSESSGPDDSDDIFERLFCGSADNIDPRMLVAVVELIQNCDDAYGPSKTQEFLSFSKEACKVVAEHLIDKASYDF